MVPDTLLVYVFLTLLFVLALLRPQWAVLACVALLPTYLLKFTLFGIPTTVLEMSIYAVFAGALVYLAIKGEFVLTFFAPFKNLRTSYFFWPIVLFIVVGLLAAVFSLHLDKTLGGWKAWVVDPLILSFLVLLFFRQGDLWKIVASLGISSAALSIYGLIEYIALPGQLGDGRLDSVFDPANYHALFVGPIIILLVGFLLQVPKMWKWIFGICTAVNISALIFTFSYGGFFAVLGGLMILGFFSLEKAWRKRVVFGALIFTAIFLILAAPTKKFQDLFEFQDRSSGHARLEIWQASARIIQNNPILGVGLNDFEYHYRKTIPKVAFPPLEWLVAQPHNLYLAILTQLGMLGFVVFAWIIFRFFQLLKVKSQELKVSHFVLMATMTAILLHGLVDTPYFKNDLSALFWIIIALGIVLSTSDKTTQK